MAKATNDPDQSQTAGFSSSDADDERLEELARQFLELWREQVAATADGAHAASAIGRLYASLGADTTRMGEGFEAWGKLIGQMAMGQHPASGIGNPIGNPMGDAMAAANPLQAMLDQMAKAARELPASPFAGMPFAPDMSAMAGMTGMKPKTAASGSGNEKSTGVAGDTSDNDGTDTAAVNEANATSKTKRAAKNAAKGQGKNDQSAKPKTASTKTRKSETGGAKTASDASGSRDDELAQLARRIADLSETIAALEAGTEGSGGNSSG